MDKFIDLNSTGWCDLVFEGRNKRYGAYRLRQASSKRYAAAFLIVVLITAVIAVLPQLYGVVENLAGKDLGPMEETVELSNLPIEKQVPEENIVKQEETPPPPPPLKSSIQFVPPVIAKDGEVSSVNYMKTQEEVRSSVLAISTADIKGTDEQNGIDISELNKTKPVVVDEKIDRNKPLEHVEQAPSFPGGPEALNKFLSDNVKYPAIAQENGIQGRVIIKFVVSRTGDIMDIQILRSVDVSLDREAIRVVQAMPKWIPGRQKGQAVPVYFTLPVEFRLNT